MAVPAQTFWKGLQRGVHTLLHSSRLKQWSCQIMPVPQRCHLAWLPALGKKIKWCHLKLVKTMSQCHRWLKSIKIGQCLEPEALPRGTSCASWNKWKGKMRFHYSQFHAFTLPHEQRWGNFSHWAFRTWCITWAFLLLPPGRPSFPELPPSKSLAVVSGC